jgi:membrane peptidoglycan carboxypeptidase
MALRPRKSDEQEASSRKRGPLRRVLRFSLWGFLALGVLGTAGLVLAYQLTDIPDPNEQFQAETTTVYYSDGKHEVGTFALQNRDAVELSDVPQRVQDAVVAAENRSFWTDPGIDVKGIARAAASNVGSESTQGASTITQQYVKILYLSQERTYTRKAKEAFLALKIQDEMSKQDILEGYLNTIYFGRGAYGIEAASQAYFGKHVADLSVAESAVLASVLNAPSRLDPAVDEANAEYLLERYRYVLSGMAEAGTLGRNRAERLSKRLPEIDEPASTNRLGGQRGYLLALVERDLSKYDFSEDEIYGGGLEVVTTFDWQAQQAVVSAVEQERPEESDVKVAVASVEPGSGALRAMYGGQDYVQSQRNWALTARQPGSAFKPFTLAAGFEQGHQLRDVFNGNAITVPSGGGEHTVHNEFDQNLGPVTLQTAIEQSSNTAFVDLAMRLENGSRDVVDSAVRAGVPRDAPALDEDAVTTTLGTADIAPVDMATSYATFAAEGERNDWYVIDTVTDGDGRVLYRHQDESRQTFDREVANGVSYALQQVIEEGTGTAALSLGRPAAGKTGTAGAANGDVISAWFVGYTPELSTAVMYVRGDDGQGVLDGVGGLDPFAGGAYPARTWTTAMTGELEGTPVGEFATPGDESMVSMPPPPKPTPSPTPAQEREQAGTTTPQPSAEPSPEATKPPKQPKPTPEPSKPKPKRPKATLPPPPDGNGGKPNRDNRGPDGGG